MNFPAPETDDGIKREYCLEYAAALGGTWTPTSWQGRNSYTLCDSQAGEILQFRVANEPLDQGTVDLAHSVHPMHAPFTKFLGHLQKEHTVGIWRMQLKHGEPYLFHVQKLGEKRISSAVIDSAKFFATSWHAPQTSTDLPDYRKTLQLLLESLPLFSRPLIQDIITQLESIHELPLVLTHEDLSCGNTLVDSSTGHITGVVDWADATVQPFGLALWGLHDLIGFHGPAGFTYVVDPPTFMKLFRTTFLQEIQYKGDLRVLELARLLGIFLRYGFKWNCDEGRRTIIKDKADLELLHTFLATPLFYDILHSCELKD